MSFIAKVKNVISGDTLVLIPTKSTAVPVPERILTLSYVRAEDYASKEFLRNLLIGKDIKVNVEFKNPTTGREFGDALAPIFKSLVEFLLSKGLVKLKENFSEKDGDIYYELTEVQNSAKLNNFGLWGETVKINQVELNEEIVQQSRSQPLKLVVEKVVSGDRVSARIFVNEHEHVVTQLLLGGIKSPRTDDPLQVKVANQAKQFVEEKLLTTKAELSVTLIGESQTGVPIGTIHHGSGNNIHQKLLELGLAEVVDWQSTLIGAAAMTVLRKAEQTAKSLGRGIYASPTDKKAPVAVVPTQSTFKVGSTIEVQISKIISGDTFNVRLNNVEHTVQLASIRSPRPSESTLGANPEQQKALIATVREFVRSHVIGKTGTLYIDGHREAKDNFDARFMVSFKYGNQDLSELLVKKGLSSVIRHNKATTGERSLNWDKLVEIEEESKQAKVGIFNTSGKIDKLLTVGTRIVDASENSTKSKTFLNSFLKGRITGYHVEYVNSINRVKLFNPKEGLKLSLIFGGLERSNEGLDFLNKKILQRQVEFDVYDIDRTGGFIGNLYFNSDLPIQVDLLELGLVKVHEIAVNSNPNSASLLKSEKSAREKKVGIWKDYTPQDLPKLEDLALEKPKFFDVEVVDVSSSGVLSFQYTLEKAKFASFKKEFDSFNAQIPLASPNSDSPYNLTKVPKKGDLVAAKFSENGKYYRARIIAFDKTANKFDVKHIDFGNIDSVGLKSLRVLPSKFNTLTYPAFVNTATLQNVALPPKLTDYLTEAIYALEDLVFDKKLVISALKGNSADFDVVLYDAEKSLKDEKYTINSLFVESGWGIVDKKNVRPVVKDYVGKLADVEKEAKRKHLGVWEFGDVDYDEQE